ncbi:hypothetical protein ACQUY5_23695 [Bacillus cereus]|uniref:hypothetical protein n=1 Tax=Bacillus cereus TaxID=1396 RepID=UPI003D170320
MKQFEYKSISKNLLLDEPSGDFDLDYINRLGLDGWEISIEGNREVLLKRELVAEEPIDERKNYQISIDGESYGAEIVQKKLEDYEDLTEVAMYHFSKNRGIERVVVKEETGNTTLPFKPVVVVSYVPYVTRTFEVIITDQNGKSQGNDKDLEQIRDIGDLLECLVKSLKGSRDLLVSIKQVTGLHEIEMKFENLTFDELDSLTTNYMAGKLVVCKSHSEQGYDEVIKIMKTGTGNVRVREINYK